MDKPSIHQWAFNLHLLLSLVFGVFISLVAMTGGIIGFEPEIDRVLHRSISYVTPGKRALTLDQLRQAVSMAYPGEPVVAILPALADNQSWHVEPLVERMPRRFGPLAGVKQLFLLLSGSFRSHRHA